MEAIDNSIHIDRDKMLSFNVEVVDEDTAKHVHLVFEGFSESMENNLINGGYSTRIFLGNNGTPKKIK